MKFSFLTHFLTFFGIVLFLSSCASTGRPSGGPKDTEPPKFVEEKSSPNLSTNYTPEKIEVVFDEWIELKNPNKEILISPPFFIKPKITQRGKKVTVEFPEEEPLRPDATYIINFGNSIVDFTEANPAEGFKFLFATGDKLDSLSFKGTIIDAYGEEPVADVLIMLYDVLGDSVVVSDKPFYYSRADEDGAFEFEYLKNDTFKLVVIEDLNYNYLLDDEVERLAFIDTSFMLNDSSDFNPRLRLFQPEQSTRILNSSSKKAGLITTNFNKKAEAVTHEILYPQDFNYTREDKEDTVKFWFAESYDSVGIIYGLDTLDFYVKPFDTTFYDGKIYLSNSNLSGSKLAPFDSLLLSFNVPILSVDTSFITLSDKPKELKIDSLSLSKDSIGINLNGADSILISNDSLVVDSTTQVNIDTSSSTIDTMVVDSIDSVKIDTSSSIIDSLDIVNNDEIDPLLDSLMAASLDTIEFYDFDYALKDRDFTISNSWKEGHDYQLIILPGGIKDIYGRGCDTIIFDFTMALKDEYGNIKLTVADLDSTEQYIVILREGETDIKDVIISDAKKKEVLFERLPSRTYNIHLIKDENRDGKWTTGDYWKRRQPELLKKFDLEKLRENWDLEATISWEGTTVDTLGAGVDSTFMQLDSLNQKLPNSIENQSKEPKRKNQGDSKDRKRGIRGRRG